MIYEKDLIEAIAECQGEQKPNANTCIKLASYYTILDHVREKSDEGSQRFENSYSYDSPAIYSSESEFGKAIQNADMYDVLETIDELMETLRIMQPRLYNAFIKKITALK